MAIAYHVLHEVNCQTSCLTDAFNAIKETGKLLISEPKGHVSKSAFEKSLNIASKVGFKVNVSPDMLQSRSAILKK